MANKKTKKSKPKKPNQAVESAPPKTTQATPEAQAGNGMAGMIKIAIIASTFISIAAISIFSQGAGDGWHGVGVVAIRFSLLSLFAVIYFVMLYLTRMSRQKDEQKPSSAKK